MKNPPANHFQPHLEDVYRTVVEEASILAALYTGPEICIRVANRLMLKAWGKDQSVIGKPIREANPEWAGQPFFDYFDTVYKTGLEYTAVEERADLLVNGVFQTFYYNFSYTPLKDADGTVWGIVHTASDVTEQVFAKNALAESERNFRNMIVQAPVAMGIYRGPQFVLTVANDKFLQLMGKSKEEALNKPLYEGLPEIKDEGIDRILDAVYKTGKGFEAKERPVPLPRNGTIETVYVDFTYTAIKEGNGITSGILAVATDVSDHVRDRRNIEEYKLFLEGITRSSPAALWRSDELGALSYINQTWIDWTGKPEQEHLGYRYLKSVCEEDRDEAAERYSEAIRTKSDYYTQFRFSHVDGAIHWGQVRGVPQFDASGAFTGYVGSVSDITEMKQLQQQKDDFISVASHELKTPLTSVKSGFQLLKGHFEKDTLIPPRLRQIANATGSNLQKLTSLVEDLLNTTRVEKGQLRLNKSVFDVVELVKESSAYINLQDLHPIVIIGDASVIIEADRQKMEQVLVNLLNNAVKYSPDNSEIRIDIASLPEKVKVSVRDFGIGIEKNLASTIFNKFYRVDSSLQYSGLGLGLYIASEIISMHNGEIGVESAPGSGSTFWFTLPKG